MCGTSIVQVQVCYTSNLDGPKAHSIIYVNIIHFFFFMRTTTSLKLTKKHNKQQIQAQRTTSIQTQ